MNDKLNFIDERQKRRYEKVLQKTGEEYLQEIAILKSRSILRIFYIALLQPNIIFFCLCVTAKRYKNSNDKENIVKQTRLPVKKLITLHHLFTNF
jgi:phage-related protein